MQVRRTTISYDRARPIHGDEHSILWMVRWSKAPTRSQALYRPLEQIVEAHRYIDTGRKK